MKSQIKPTFFLKTEGAKKQAGRIKRRNFMEIKTLEIKSL